MQPAWERAPRRLLPSPAGAPQPRAAPAVKARGRPGPEAAEFARRSPGGRPAGPPGGRGGTQSARSSPGSKLTAVGKTSSRHIRRCPRAAHLGEGDAAQPGAWAGHPHPASERKEARKVSKVWEGAGAFLKEASLLGPRGAEGKIKGGGWWWLLTWAGSALANVKPFGSQMAGGTRGRLPRAASGEQSPRAGQAPPDPVHAGGSRGAGALGSGRPRPQVRRPRRALRSVRQAAHRPRRRSCQEAGRCPSDPRIRG